MKNRIIVITGASSGIGLATAKVFMQNGDKVINVSQNENKDIEFAESYAADITDEARMAEIFAEVGEKFGHIDILINNAGYGLSGATELIPTEDVRKLFDVNVVGKFICTKYALPFMPKGSKIFYTSSSMAVHPVPFRTLYGASKAAVRSISLAQRMELKHFGIDVCCIMPGQIKTNFSANRVKHFDTNERYGERIQRAHEKLANKESHRMPPETVARAIFKQAARRRTKPQVIVGGKHRILYFFTRRVPLSWYLNAAEKSTGGN